MSQLTRFHLFPQLPPELQDMIWAKYDDEVDPVIWHEFFYVLCSLRHIRRHTTGSTKLDNLEGLQSYRVRRPDDKSSTDDEHKKKSMSKTLAPLAGVNLPLHPRVRIDASSEPQCGDGRRPGPAHFRARLDRDVFYFTHSGPAPKNFLGFLSPCAAGQDPPPLADDHWFFRIRKLAIGFFPSPWGWGAFDRATLSRHKHLRVIYVVTGEAVYAEPDSYWDGKTTDGFTQRSLPASASAYMCGALSAIFKDHAVRPSIHNAVEVSRPWDEGVDHRRWPHPDTVGSGRK